MLAFADSPAVPVTGLLAETVVGAAMIAVVVVLTKAHRTEMSESRLEWREQIDKLTQRSAEHMDKVSESLAEVAHELRELRDEVRKV